MSVPRHVLQIYIRAEQEVVWQAITDPEFTRRYFHGTAIDSTFEPGAPLRYAMPDGRDAVDGTVEVADRPDRLVTTWRVLYDAAMAEEAPSRVEWRLETVGQGLTKLTVVHGDLGRSPLTSASVGHGWPWVLGSLKSCLETGDGLPPETAAADAQVGPDPDADGESHRRVAIDANNSAWELLGQETLSEDEAEDLLRRVYAAAYHWARAARRAPENEARAEYMIAKAQWKVGRAELALHHADRCLRATQSAGLADFDLAYAHEARARALALAGRDDESSSAWAAARSVPIADPEDRAILDADFADGPPEG